MFVEPNLLKKRGWVEVITGSMFSGKTEELIRRLKRARYANQKVQIFKPQVDTRYDENDVVSHDENRILSTPVSSSQNIMLLIDHTEEVIAIDEAQFFDEGLSEVCRILALKGMRVIVAGLDMDYLGNPFGPMPAIMADAEYITKLHAICMVCGNLASYSFRKTSEDKTILLGETDSYEPRCRFCFDKGMKGK